MEIVDWKWEQNEMEVEEGEGGLQVRSSKVTKEVTNGKIETNGHGNSTLKMTNGTEKSVLGDEQERSEEEKLSDSINGVEDEEGTEPKDKLFEHIVVSINGVEEKSDLDDEQERSEEHISDFNNGVEEGTEKSDLDDELERSEEQHISDSYNGVEVEEETKPKEESVQHILLSNNGVEVEVHGETKPKEESVQLIVASNNGVEEGTEPKEEPVQKIVASNNGVEERTEPKEESVQRIVSSNCGVEEGTEPKEESKQHLVTSTNGVEVEEGTEAEEDSVQQIVVVSNNGVEEGTEPKEESKQHLVTFTNGVEVEEGAEESIQHIVVSNNEVEEGTEPKKESKQHLVISTNGVEEGTEAEEGPFSSGHSVYYDKDEGIWKCRACSWTLQGKSLDIGWTKIPRGYLDKLINYPMLDQRGSKDSNFISTHSIKEKIYKIPGDEGVQESATLDIHLNGYLKSYNLSSSSVQFPKNLSEDHSIVHKSTAIDEIESADPDLIDDSDTDVKDFDVENVLQKQNTHDLYCPNCKSCITKRVILRKRKRKIRVSGDDVKRVKPEVVVDSKVDASHAQAADDEVRDGADCSLPPLAVDDYQPDREPELFRCLSCFSFFIPAGSGFKLFRFFGDKGAKENVKGEQTPTKNKKWFSPIFGLDKGKAPVEQGSGIGASVVKNDSGVLMPSAPPAYSSSEITQEAGGKILGSKNQDANMKGKMVIDTVGKSENATKSREAGSVLDIFDSETYNQPSVSASSNEVQGNDKNDELLRNTGRIQVSNGNLVQESLPAPSDKKDQLLRPGGKIQSSNGNLVQDSVPASQQNELKLLITSTKEESLTIEKSETDLKSDGGILNKDPATTAFALNGLDGNGKPNFLTEIPQEHVQHIEAMFSSESLVANNDNKFQLSSEGNDTIITVEAGHETRETASANLDTQIQSVEGQATDGADGYKIEIIKSIIFGGLAESITSLSVVASATGGDTTTLNILVLAMANLIGGLFIIFHNLWELKRDRFEQASNQIMEKHVDRYREQLGRRENFTLHAVLVILSYIIFGLLPPVTYGFSFRKSDDKDLKIVAVAAASLVCILMLATGKAYVQRAPKPYFKTISTYIILGFTVSGVSYAAGILFNRLLEKFGFFQPSSTLNLFLPEMPETGAAWASF
ncbi:membrane protein of ER body-like protein isoform X5 [Solanum tuberosum]|uniref:membrane protein of ER body-like protein isoform X5 n=1 Tax=Solanum tuberosum TaxID=4113 RepID=UPI00073A0247|nr:PREDICTED: membrane protein of ER body-like protein isoform X5 [Solanum tuberosum]